MDKRKEANIRAKNAISQTLFDLMQSKSIHDISISELISKAGVARATFYRNYSSKEDVLITFVRDVLENYRQTIDYDATDYLCRENVVKGYQYFYDYKRYVLDLYNSGYGSMLLEELNQFHESIAGVMPANSPKRYTLYFYIGALYNSAITWLLEEKPVSIETIAETLMQSLKYI